MSEPRAAEEPQSQRAEEQLQLQCVCVCVCSLVILMSRLLERDYEQPKRIRAKLIGSPDCRAINH